MAIVKHIKSRNANYSDALNYLIFQHDESTGKMILDEFDRPLRRDELYVDVGTDITKIFGDKVLFEDASFQIPLLFLLQGVSRR